MIFKAIKINFDCFADFRASSAEFVLRNFTFGLVTDIDHDAVVCQTNDETLDDHAFLNFGSRRVAGKQFRKIGSKARVGLKTCVFIFPANAFDTGLSCFL